MSGDPIGEHARALRDAHDGTSADAAATRLRILAVAYARARRRRALVLTLAPLAAVFLLSTAWAAVTGRLPRVLSLFTTTRSTEAAPMASAKPSPAGGTTEAPAPVPTMDSPSPGQVEQDLPSPAAVPPTAPSRAKATAQEGGTPGTPPRVARADDASTVVADAEESLYAAAHHAHFEARDPLAALRAWNAYLAAYPDGRFALEARYNRALALVRLGRASEARAALAPFADGSYGGYRRAEAKALVDALPPP
jgi:hypothetical protein